MSGALDMTLDESIKRGKAAKSGGRRGTSRRGRGHGSNGFLGGGRGNGPARRGPLAVNNSRTTSFTINKASSKTRPYCRETDFPTMVLFSPYKSPPAAFTMSILHCHATPEGTRVLILPDL